MKPLPRLITVPYRLERAPPPFETYDPRDADKFPESLARYFIKAMTKKGDRVFDPFAGLGTTLFVAEEMGRKAFGMEADGNRAAWVAGQLDNWTGLVCGDSAAMGRYPFPKMDFVLTSPPYMPHHHKWNPLAGGNPAKAGYKHYLSHMAAVFRALAGTMKKNARVVVQADNLPGQRGFTPLVWDIGNAARQSLTPEGEVIVAWENAPKDYPYTHCLVFKNTKR